MPGTKELTITARGDDVFDFVEILEAIISDLENDRVSAKKGTYSYKLSSIAPNPKEKRCCG